ncbi:MAG: phycobilisome rod-core linker polypeptide, partial [Thiotrichaceae bacterium]|nr:phycobilisome rod-core linker polypeptide [Thiotrichaceae bacterium]
MCGLGVKAYAYTQQESILLTNTAYCSILNREADEGGFNNAIDLLDNKGWTVKQLIQSLATSEEFKQRFFDNKPTSEYVTYIYNLFLQRVPDPEGLANWVNVVEQQGWTIIIDGMLESDEYIQNFGNDLIPTTEACSTTSSLNPTLLKEGSSWRLKVPYVEYQSPFGKFAYTFDFISNDAGNTYIIDFNTLSEIKLNPALTDPATLVQLKTGWLFNLPQTLDVAEDNIIPVKLFSSDGIKIEPINSICTVLDTVCDTLNTLIPPSDNLVAWLGAGLDSDRNWLKQEDCLAGTSELIGTSQATFSSSLFTSYKDVLEIEKKSAGGKLSVKFFSAHANAKYEKMFRQTSYAQSYMLRYDVDLGTKRFKISSLSDRGIQAANGGACSFQRYCGNKYVSQVTQGGSVEVGLNFKFKTTSQKREFEAGGGFGFEGEICCVPVSAQLKASVGRLSSKTKKESSIEIVAYQEGGRVEDLINIFGTQNNTTECALDNLDPCLRAVDDVVAYIQSGFAPTLRDNPTTTAYEYASYDSVIGVPNLAIEVTPEIAQARQELADSYEKSLIALDKVGNLLQYSLEPQRQQKMEQLQAALLLDIKHIEDAAKTCFSNLSQCLVEKCAVIDTLTDYTLEELELGYQRNDALLLYLGFDFNTEDYSLYKNHGVATGNLTYTPDGILGAAAKFNGATYVTIPNTDPFKFSNSSFTFSVWVDIFDNINVYRGYISLTDSYAERIELAKYRTEAGGG